MEDSLETRYYLELPSHENIVKFIDYFFDDNISDSRFYMVYEYCEVNINLVILSILIWLPNFLKNKREDH